MYDSVMPMHQGRELPQFTLRQIDLPEVSEWEVNDEYYIIMKVKMTGKRNRKDLESKEDRQKIEGDFEMMSIKALGEKPVDVKTLEQEDFEQTYAKVRSGKI